MNLVWNADMLEWFVINVLPPLEPDEVYFVSLSARNKYLTAEERTHYALGRTEMFARTTADSKAHFLSRALPKMYASLSYRRTKSGLEFPRQALVTYMNVNASSMTRAWFELQRKMAQVQEEFVAGKMRGNRPSTDGFLNLEREMMNCVQRATGSRKWLDVDFDTEHHDLLGDTICALTDMEIPWVEVETQGGWHLLVDRVALKGSNYRLHEEANGGEVVFNSNNMVPLPGTLQAGVPVKITGYSGIKITGYGGLDA